MTDAPGQARVPGSGPSEATTRDAHAQTADERMPVMVGATVVELLRLLEVQASEVWVDGALSPRLLSR
jgi:hypothetical protein